MFRLFGIILMVVALAACGSGGGDDVVSVEVEGKIYNDNELAWAAGVTVSTLGVVNTTEPVRLPDVSLSNTITIAAEATNTGTVDLRNLTIHVEYDQPTAAKPEHWTCYLNYNYLDGTGSHSFPLWEEYTEPSQACEGVPYSAEVWCPINSPALDCDNPWWDVRYTPQNDGVRSLDYVVDDFPAGNMAKFGVRTTDVSEGIDRLGRVWVEDSQGEVLAVQDFIFNVVP